MKIIPITDYYTHLLFSIPLFQGVSEQMKHEIINTLDFRLQEICKDTVILEQGDACSHLYILLEGQLEVNIIDANGNEILIEHIEATRAFATPHLFNQDNRFPATFKTTCPSVLFTATKDSTFHLISKYPEVLKSFLCISGNCKECTTNPSGCLVPQNHSGTDSGLSVQKNGPQFGNSPYFPHNYPTGRIF